MVKEFDGKTEEEAVKKAMEELNAKDFEYEVISEGGKGIFKKPLVKIRVYLNESSEPSGDSLEKLDELSHKESENEELIDVSEFDKLTESEEWVVKFVKELTKLMGLEIEPRVSQRTVGGKHYVDLKSNDEALVIGKGGDRLDAIQNILSACFYKSHPESEERFILDVDGYRKMRVEGILKSARSVAKRVEETGRSVLLEPLNAFERREVHKMINGFPNLASESEGYGATKRIRIFKVK